MWAKQKKEYSRRCEQHPPLSSTDKRCLLALAGLWLAVGIMGEALDSGPVAEPVDKPCMEITWEAPLDQPQFVEAVMLQLEPAPYREDVPLSPELQTALQEACQASGVPVHLALGLIEVESGFQVDVVSSEGCVGLCQLNPRYFPADLTPAENIAAGIGYLGELLAQHDDTAAALTAYNAGHDTGSRTYANAVLRAAERWED